MITRSIHLLGLLLTMITAAVSQPTKSNLAVKKYAQSSLAARCASLLQAKEDTAKADLLLEISSICHRRQSRGAPDSSVMYARRAAILSKKLGYTPGYCDAIFLICKSHLRKPDFAAAERTLLEAEGELKVRLLLVLSEFHLERMDDKPEQIRKAFPYIQAARRLSAQVGSRHWMTESTIVMAKWHFRLGQMTPGKNCFYEVINYHRNIRDKAGEAHWWQELGRYIPDTDSTYATEIYALRRARKLFREAGDVKEEADCLQNEGFIHSQHGRYDLTEKYYLEELALLKAAGIHRKMSSCYQRLSHLFAQRRNLDKALEFALLGLENIKAVKDSSRLMWTHEMIGDLQRTIGNHAESIRSYKLAVSTGTQSTSFLYSVVKRMTEVQLETGHAREALAYLTSLLKTRGMPESVVDRQVVALIKADCYAGMREFALAEKHYMEVIRLNGMIEGKKTFYWYAGTKVFGAEANLAVGKFYAGRKRYDKSARFLANALKAGNLTVDIEKEARYLLFRNDSLTGNLPPATVNFQRYVFLQDSIQRVTKNEQLDVLRANFKTAQREKDIQILQREALLRDRQLELSRQKARVTYAGVFALFCLLGLTYNSFRIKRNKNRQLQSQQELINIKNAALLKLVDEKELLMKEVHHRVKNNLQTVTSLLTSQSFHLKDQVAAKAIDESRNRIHAISMLHQRIYQSENMVEIGMKSYVVEMVYNLEDCFDSRDRITFKVLVEDMKLDLAQAVPIGLILNEAITNCLKYAFNDGREGIITISLTRTGTDLVTLCVADNGRGLPPGFDLDNSPTFGLQLIKGLTQDLGGTLTFRSVGGTTMEIAFSLGYPVAEDEAQYSEHRQC